jgi:FkbM family methyltransferase
MSSIGAVKSRFATAAVRRVLRWASARPEICLHDPKAGERPEVRLGLPHRVRLGGLELSVEIENMRQYKRWRAARSAMEKARHGSFAPSDPIGWLLRYAQKEDVLYDIGANIGIFTSLASAVAPGIRVLSFEPEPNSFLQLCRMIRSNTVNATPYPFAISDRVTVDRFFVNRNFEAGLSQHQFGRTVDYARNAFTPDFAFGAAAFPVDALVQEHGLPAPTIVKIDVDGLEPLVIAGMDKTIEAGTIHSLIVEVCDAETGRQLVEHMRARRYRCVIPEADFAPEGSFDICFRHESVGED